ncbi:MAG: hypothetical protein GY791_16190 [Alphaproteobacteria bacterium]|nr:hypothetical protein [Alphaproteobacteria bacterium]
MGVRAGTRPAKASGIVAGAVMMMAVAGTAGAGETVTVTMTKEQWDAIQSVLPRLNELES